MNYVLEDLANSGESGKKEVEFIAENAYLGLRCFKPKMLVNPTVLTDKELQALQVPTLILFGKNEKTYSASDAVNRLKNTAPHINVEVIPNAGHDLILVQTKTVTDLILEFLEKQ